METQVKRKCPSCGRTGSSAEWEKTCLCIKCKTMYLKETDEIITKEQFELLNSTDATQSSTTLQPQSPPPVQCPKCGSTQITMTKRGWKLTTGFIGSGKMLDTCMACGHQWDPKK
ncbi:MAG: hypothetical protein RSF40_08890 [Oscillospiraceae bacterium]